MLHLLNEFGNYMPNPNNNPESLVNGNYYDISQIKNLKISDNNKSLSIFSLKHMLFFK